MSYRLSWYDDAKTIIVARAGERLSYPEMDTMFREAVRLFDETSERVYVILDLAELKRVESMNVREMQRLGQHPFTKHPRRVMTCVASLNPRVRILVDAFARLFPRYTRGLTTADDFNHALQLIAAHKQKFNAPC